MNKVACAVLLVLGLVSRASDLKEPLTLSSENDVLDILMVAKAAPISTLPANPTGWVYEICKRPAQNVSACPQADPLTNYYGGTLLKLQKGDLLRIHLVNQLPLALDSKHASEDGHEFLSLNPTNLHTHGLLVDPRPATATNPTYGDYVFVLTFNSANGKPTTSPHMHSDIRYDSTDYEIRIPANHPSGLYWFHPHAHGISLNQVSAGLSGLITIGDIGDYFCKSSACREMEEGVNVRHMMLKDAQILPQEGLQDQENPTFCAPKAAKHDPPRQGFCQGQDFVDEDGENYRTGRWYFTVNGQVFPTIPIRSKGGEIWRITNASGSATYDLHLWHPKQNRQMLFQVISIDGVSISPDKGRSVQLMTEVAGGKFKAEVCPSESGGSSEDRASQAVCTRTLHMMPSSRAEVWVTYRDASDKVAVPPAGSSAIFRTDGYQTGPAGDSWPRIDLAAVNFEARGMAALPDIMDVSGEATEQSAPLALAKEMRQLAPTTYSDSCHPLPPGHLRRVFYGVPTDNLNAFGLAYEEVDEHGRVVGPAATDLLSFDPMTPTVCVSLGPNDTPAIERWQLVNVATEDHNFHLHQTKFRVVTKDELQGSLVPKGVMLDNVPLARANGACGSNPPGDLSNPIAAWRSGACKSEPVTVEIPFAIPGDFLYHCHILEHEDGGMMARIRVRRHQ